MAYFQTSERRGISAIQQRTAADVARGKASATDVELTKNLETAASAAMYDAGKLGETRGYVENLIIRYFNNLVSENWSDSNITVTMPSNVENDLSFEWKPNGSLVIKSYLDAKFEHVMGSTVYGLELRAKSQPPFGGARFQRQKHVAELIQDKAGKASDLDVFEREVNDNYACEGLSIDIKVDDKISVGVTDNYAGEVAYT